MTERLVPTDIYNYIYDNLLKFNEKTVPISFTIPTIGTTSYPLLIQNDFIDLLKDQNCNQDKIIEPFLDNTTDKRAHLEKILKDPTNILLCVHGYGPEYENKKFDIINPEEKEKELRNTGYTDNEIAEGLYYVEVVNCLVEYLNRNHIVEIIANQIYKKAGGGYTGNNAMNAFYDILESTTPSKSTASPPPSAPATLPPSISPPLPPSISPPLPPSISPPPLNTIDEMKKLINLHTLQYYNDNAYIINNMDSPLPDFNTYTSDKTKLKALLNDATTNKTKFNFTDVSTNDAKYFHDKIITQPINVLAFVHANGKNQFNNVEWTYVSNPTTNDDKFLNLMAYYLNVNKVWQNVINMINNPKSKTPSTSMISPTGLTTIYKYSPNALGTSNFNVDDFKPWNQFGTTAFGSNLSVAPFGGNLFPTNFYGGRGQTGGGQQCGQTVKNIVDTVLNAHDKLIDKAAKTDIDNKLNNNIKIETLINQKLQQIIAISHQQQGVTNDDVVKYIDQLKTLLNTLSSSQGVLYNTLRSVVATSGIVKVPTPPTNYVDIATLLGGCNSKEEHKKEMICLLEKIANKIGAV